MGAPLAWQEWQWHEIAESRGQTIDRLARENSKLRELVRALLTSHEKMCTQRGNCFGCTFFYEEVKACPYVKISRTLRKLGIEVDA